MASETGSALRATATRPGPQESPTPGALLETAIGGDRDAWDALVDRYAGSVWAVARSCGLDSHAAADVSQTTWLRLVENMGRIRDPDRVGAWLVTTARRESIRLSRLSRRSPPIGEDQTLDALAGSDSPIDDTPIHHADRHAVVDLLVSRLPYRQQLILRLLNGHQEMSYQEISEMYGIPIGSIGPTRARALEHLRRLCARAGITEY